MTDTIDFVTGRQYRADEPQRIVCAKVGRIVCFRDMAREITGFVNTDEPLSAAIVMYHYDRGVYEPSTFCIDPAERADAGISLCAVDRRVEELQSDRISASEEINT